MTNDTRSIDQSNPYDTMLLSIPERQPGALTGSQFAQTISNLPLGNDREQAIYQQYQLGNVPDFMRRPVEVTVTAGVNSITYPVLPDYLCVGSDDDYLRTPMTPITAQKIAYLFRCCLPTRKMVNDIWFNADIKLAPSPQPPGAIMTTTNYFVQHNATIQNQLDQANAKLGQLIVGHKKDVVITPLLLKYPQNVAIYGWTQLNGQPIQGLNPVSHNSGYADYSHGIRLILSSITVNGKPSDIFDAFVDTPLVGLLSDEGPVSHPFYNV